jgi:hypothetical protein
MLKDDLNALDALFPGSLDILHGIYKVTGGDAERSAELYYILTAAFLKIRQSKAKPLIAKAKELLNA